MMIAYDNYYFSKMLPRVAHYFAVAFVTRSRMIIRGFIDGVPLGFKLKRWVKKTSKADGLKEPRVNIPVFKWYLYMFKAYIKYGSKATHITYVTLSAAITRHINRLGVNNSPLDPLKE
jgi:hypothetical protein